jgi:uncharacterized damage-inducible protein DinB
MSEPLTITAAVLGDLDRELAATRRVLEALPDGAWNFRPRAGAWSFGDLANHLVELTFWLQTVLDRDEFDAAAGSEGPAAADGREQVLRAFDGRAALVRAATGPMDAARLGADWALRDGSTVVFRARRAEVLRRCLNHLIHHRGQLVLYVRMQGIAPPLLYEG